nr:zinc finger, CCHC-type [Tanacetum cinerariifolium]
MPKLMEDSTVEAIRIRAKWENDDYICRGHILNEESLRAQDSDKGKGKEVAGPSVNMTEEGKNKNNKKKERNVISKNTIVVRVPTRNLSWNVGSVVRLVTSRGIAVVVIRRTQMMAVREKGLRIIPKTKVDAIAWWIDFDATAHVCKDHCWFKTYEQVEDGSVLYMGDDHFAPVHGKGRFGYYNNGMFMLNLNKVPDDSDSVYMSSSTVVNSLLWHARLGHGCKAVVRLPDPKRKTLVEKESRDAIFDENRFSSILRPNDIIPNSDESQRDDHSDDVPSEIPKPRKGKEFGKLNHMVLIFRKMKVDGTIDKFKARLVIQGFRQKEMIDYFDTYAPVARITIIRLLLALSAIHNLVIHQMDVKTSFLNGDLEEKVYRKQLEGFVMPGNEHKLCKLVKSLHKLKQAPKQWHQKFDEVVLSSGFLLNQSDKCVYSKFDSSSKGVIIFLYVDDMLIFETDQNQVDKTKKFLSSRFFMKDMGEADLILDCSPVSTPMDPVEKLKPNIGPALTSNWAVCCTLNPPVLPSIPPEGVKVPGRLSRFTSNPSRHHWQAITRVFKYLKGTMNYGLSYVGYHSVLEAYSDASWINHVEDSSSTSGWVFLLGGGGVWDLSCLCFCRLCTEMDVILDNVISNHQQRRAIGQNIEDLLDTLLRAAVRLPDPKRKTLGEKGIDCIFVGYVEHSKAYRPNDIIPNSDESQRDDHSDYVPSEIPKPRKGCKRIFKRKMKVDGTIDKFKARLVIQGFRQKEMIDYFDAYAPVSRITIIRLLLALSAIHNLVIHQMDVKTSFLNGDLEEKVYRKQPEGFVMPGNEHKLCKLVKSLHELKQAPMQWHQKFNGVVLSSGFLLNQSDKCVYSKFDSSGPAVTSNWAVCCTLNPPVLPLILPEGVKVPGRLSRFTSNPSRHHWQAITRVFKYLKGTMNYGLSYVGYPLVLEAYSDASWINHVEDSSSTSGWVFLLGGDNSIIVDLLDDVYGCVPWDHNTHVFHVVKAMHENGCYFGQRHLQHQQRRAIGQNIEDLLDTLLRLKDDGG